MAAALRRIWDWANQPVSLGRRSKQAITSTPAMEFPNPSELHEGLPKSLTDLDLTMGEGASANDEDGDTSAPLSQQEPTHPDDYLGRTADEVEEGLKKFLEAYAITKASQLSWGYLLDEVKVIQLKRLRLAELEYECEKIRHELQECKKNLTMQAKRAMAEESLTISMHEKRLELARALTRRIDAL